MNNVSKNGNAVIQEWGSPFENMTDEAKELRRQYLQFCDGCTKAYDFTCSGADAEKCNKRKEELLNRIYDITDTRCMCVVTAKEDNIPCVRHVFRVSEDAEKRLDELKKEYYSDYTQLTTDEFHFFTGYHRADAFMRNYNFKQRGSI